MKDGAKVVLGVLLALGGHLILAGIAALASLIVDSVGAGGEPLAVFGMAILAVPGITQLLWVAPLGLLGYIRGWTYFLWGLLITSGLVFLLNAGCWGVLGAAGTF
jgi:hypothetical protein